MGRAPKPSVLSLWVREDYVKKLIYHASQRGVLLTKLLREGLSEILLNDEIYRRPYMTTRLDIPTDITRIFDAMNIEDSKLRCAITHVAIEKLVYRLQFAPGTIETTGESDRILRCVDGLGSLLKHKRPTRRMMTWRRRPKSSIEAGQQTNQEDDK